MSQQAETSLQSPPVYTPVATTENTTTINDPLLYLDYMRMCQQLYRPSKSERIGKAVGICEIKNLNKK